MPQTFCFVWSLQVSHETSHWNWNWNRQTLFSFFHAVFSFSFRRNIVTVHICNGCNSTICLHQMQKHFNCTVCYGYHLWDIYNGIIIEWLFDKIINVCLLLYISCWYKCMKYAEHTWCQCDFVSFYRFMTEIQKLWRQRVISHLILFLSLK